MEMNSRHHLKNTFFNKKVVLTGHTGFKGSWLSEWLLMLGAEVTGISLEPATDPSLFSQLDLTKRLNHNIIDIRNRQALVNKITEVEPDFVFHLAAQPLVRLSYFEPVETYQTNVMGTIHVLEALRELQDTYRSLGRHCTAVFVTTDKCYENREWVHGYRENDPMGGYDPYSSSKAAAEIAIASYRRSYFNSAQHRYPPNIGIASARAGNVIGGGDWSQDRIIPDCIRSLLAGQPIQVRNKQATRPWQHVLEPLLGYMMLAGTIHDALAAKAYDNLEAAFGAFNFGPHLEANQNVCTLVEKILTHWPGEWTDISDASSPHEAGKLNLVWDKAFHYMGWAPRWQFSETVARTVSWYRDQIENGISPRELVLNDIRAYERALNSQI